MTVLDSDIPNIVNTIDISVAKLQQSRGENMPRAKAEQEFNDALVYLNGLSDWFRQRLKDAQHMQETRRKIEAIRNGT